MILIVILFVKAVLCGSLGHSEMVVDDRCNFTEPLVEYNWIAYQPRPQPKDFFPSQIVLSRPNFPMVNYYGRFSFSSYNLNEQRYKFNTHPTSDFNRETCTCMRKLANSPKAGSFIKYQANKHCAAIYCAAEAEKFIPSNFEMHQLIKQDYVSRCFYRNEHLQLLDIKNPKDFSTKLRVDYDKDRDQNISTPLQITKT